MDLNYTQNLTDVLTPVNQTVVAYVYNMDLLIMMQIIQTFVSIAILILITNKIAWGKAK